MKLTKFTNEYQNPRKKLPLQAGDLVVGKGPYKGNVAIVYGSCFNDYSLIYLNEKKPEVNGFPWDDWDKIWIKIGKVHDIDLYLSRLGKGYDWSAINRYGYLECLLKEVDKVH